MKKILTAAIAVSILASAGAGAAYAQPQRHDNGHQQAQQSFERHADRRYKGPRYVPPRGYQARAWHRGDRLPDTYRGRGYVVDYRTYKLAPPPRGYQYVRVNNDVVLTAITTGVIASVITQLFQ